ncbi:hypothetical protein NC653_026797 [Populus alba x Populus x berolinensis]|uniref:Uncharacterized protein n=1 Tax=Populus alba x Populus x berolinensis TaxID=444605 RepID=A0AAD6M3Y5_9ROSI|nr:hypothetical protein NC653_026797 [Populus alba x Populus x berolinensis]
MGYGHILCPPHNATKLYGERDADFSKCLGSNFDGSGKIHSFMLNKLPGINSSNLKHAGEMIQGPSHACAHVHSIPGYSSHRKSFLPIMDVD